MQTNTERTPTQTFLPLAGDGSVTRLLLLAAEQRTFRTWAGLTVLSRIWAAGHTLAVQDVLDVNMADIITDANAFALDQIKANAPSNDAIGMTMFFAKAILTARERGL